MTVLRLHGPLRGLAGGSPEQEIGGGTVAEMLGGLEQARPALAGWVLDERGRIRRHINVFVNGERASETTPVAPQDRVEVIPAISGGGRGAG